MSSGNNSKESASFRGNGGKNRKMSTKQLFPKAPQRGMGVAKLEKIRLAALNDNSYQQEFDMGGLQAAGSQSAYVPWQAPMPPLYPFGYHQQANTAIAMMNFGGGVNNMSAAHAVNPQPSSWDRSYAYDINTNTWAPRHQQQQPHFGQHLAAASPRPISFNPARAREMDLLGERRRRKEEGVVSGDEEIDLELRL